MNNCVIIPNYKIELSKNEQIAFDQCMNVLGNHSIFFISPHEVYNENYEKVTGVKYYDKGYFESRAAYSLFMLEDRLYRDFIDYDYILIYQLDAFVFSDRLDEFCNMDYDYIGAPWPYGVCLHTVGESKVVYVGNGGFSLRKTKSFFDWTHNKRKEIEYLYENCTRAEDYIISFIGDISIAPIEIAYQFAVEAIPSEYKSIIRVPFGAHNVIAYNYDWAYRHYKEYGFHLEKTIRIIRAHAELKKKETAAMDYGYTEASIRRAILGLLGEDEVAIWGCGFYANKIYSLLKRAKIRIKYFIETEPSVDYKFGLDVFASQDYFNNKNEKIIVAMQDTNIVEKTLLDYSKERNKDYVIFEDIIDFVLMDNSQYKEFDEL